MEENRVLDECQPGQLYQIPVDRIDADPDQPRKFFDEKQINKLAESVKNKGVLQPIIVRKDGERAKVIAGERRLRAAREAGLATIPAIFVGGDSSEISLIENLQRENLNPIEEAEAIVRLIESKGYQDKDLVPILGKAKSTISEMKKLNELPDKIKDQCRNSNEWSRNILLEIAKQPTPKQMIDLFNEVKKKNLKGREVRAITRGHSRKRDKVTIVVSQLHNVSKAFIDFNYDDIEEDRKRDLRNELKNTKKMIETILDNLKDKEETQDEFLLFDELSEVSESNA